MADEKRELNLNELDGINGGIITHGAASGLTVDSGVHLPADDGVGLIDSTRPKLPFTTLEEANDYAGKVGLALFDTIEAANNWINTGNRATLL